MLHKIMSCEQILLVNKNRNGVGMTALVEVSIGKVLNLEIMFSQCYTYDFTMEIQSVIR